MWPQNRPFTWQKTTSTSRLQLVGETHRCVAHEKRKSLDGAESVGRVMSRIDKANGYVFQGGGRVGRGDREDAAAHANALFSAVSSNTEMNAERTLFVQERYRRREQQEQQQNPAVP